jgi:uncharacterized membrane protein
MISVLPLLIGLLNGLRSFTAPAVTAWATYLGWLKLDGPLALIGSLPAVIILTVLALGELVVDKLPQTPRRTLPLGIGARLLMGGVSGACIAAAGNQAAIIGALLGAMGGVLGGFGGYMARVGLVKTFGTRDLYVALLEDLVAIGGSLMIVTRF